MTNLEALWDEYKKTDSKMAKDKLLVEYSKLVKYIADRIGYSLPASVDKNDLISSGIFGLIKAVETFEPDRDISIGFPVLYERNPANFKKRIRNLKMIWVELHTMMKCAPILIFLKKSTNGC